MFIHNAEKLPALTGLRFVLAMLIVVGHAKSFSACAARLGNYPWSQAVPMFFVLSGFILGYVYPKFADWSAVGRYGWARFARIYPVHLATFLLLIFLLEPGPFPKRTSLDQPAILLTNLTLTQNWINDANYFLAFNSPAWSISIEVFFYLCFPLLVFRWRYTWWLALAGAFVLKWKLQFWLPGQIGTTCPPMRLYEFVIGMCTASVFRWLQPRWHTKIVPATLLELAVIGGLLYAQLYPGRVPLTPFSLPYCFGAVILVLAINQGIVGRVLSLSPLVMLGEASYALYLLHQIVLRYWRINFLPGMADEVFFWSYLAVSIAGSCVLWGVVERPVRGWLMSGWAGRAKTAIPLPSVPQDSRVLVDSARAA